MDKTAKDTCPRCGHGIPNDERRGEYPGALSRYDNKTYVCSDCGAQEALWNLRYPGEPLPPCNIDLMKGPVTW